MVADYYGGRFPVPKVQIVLALRYGDGVGFGQHRNGRWIRVNVGRDTSLEELRKDPERRSVITWLVLGVGAGAAATGGAFHALALQSKDDADNADSPTTYDTAVSAYEAQRTGAITAYTVGGALIGLGIYLLVRDDGTSMDAAGVYPTPDGVMVRF